MDGTCLKITCLSKYRFGLISVGNNVCMINDKVHLCSRLDVEMSDFVSDCEIDGC